ncbi:MAG: SCO1664 family protein [Actinobacteria bacterium]|nr:SCO1664 family protein [Actinomycetota bacterium]
MATDVDLTSLLSESELNVHGRLVDSSNNALVVEIATGSDSTPVIAVYKPAAGERPLWDFPDTALARREVAAYTLSQQLGWDIVPQTVWREQGPAGPGMCQLWIDTEPTDSYINLFAAQDVPATWQQILEGRDEHDRPVVLAHSDDDALRRLAVFDVIANNADRKAGHLLLSSAHPNRHLWAIDHGLTFHTEPKLRTVIWGFAGEKLPQWLQDDLGAFIREIDRHSAALGLNLSAAEVDATFERASTLLDSGEFPRPSGDGPAVPWPVY